MRRAVRHAIESEREMAKNKNKNAANEEGAKGGVVRGGEGGEGGGEEGGREEESFVSASSASSALAEAQENAAFSDSFASNFGLEQSADLNCLIESMAEEHAANLKMGETAVTSAVESVAKAASDLAVEKMAKELVDQVAKEEVEKEAKMRRKREEEEEDRMEGERREREREKEREKEKEKEERRIQIEKEKEKDKHTKATKLQSIVRGKRGRRTYGELHEAKKRAKGAILLQGHGRRILARKVVGQRREMAEVERQTKEKEERREKGEREAELASEKVREMKGKRMREKAEKEVERKREKLKKMETLGERISGDVLEKMVEEEIDRVMEEKRDEQDKRDEQEKQQENAEVVVVAEEELAIAAEEEIDPGLPPLLGGTDSFPPLVGQKSISSSDPDSDDDDMYDFDAGADGSNMPIPTHGTSSSSTPTVELPALPEPDWEEEKVSYTKELFDQLDFDSLWAFIEGEGEGDGAVKVEGGGAEQDSLELSQSGESSFASSYASLSASMGASMGAKELAPPMPIPIDLFLKMEVSRVGLTVAVAAGKGQNDKKPAPDAHEMAAMQMYHKALFDSVNESLVNLRNSGEKQDKNNGEDKIPRVGRLARHVPGQRAKPSKEEIVRVVSEGMVVKKYNSNRKKGMDVYPFALAYEEDDDKEWELHIEKEEEVVGGELVESLLEGLVVEAMEDVLCVVRNR